ncbi:MAG: hypothetical protein ACTSQO_12580 [Candidatus Helarchaeota archaeon]
MADLNQDLYMITFKVIEVFVYLFCAITIYRKKRGYILNRTYFIALSGWVVYILLDAILFPVGHIEPFSFGYISVNSGLATIPMIANILRDIAVAAGGVLAFGFLYASIIIRFGEARAKEKRTLLIMLGGYFLLVIPTIIFDQIIKEINLNPVTVHTQFNIPSAIMILAQIIVYFIGVYELFVIYRKISDKNEKRRILFFILGVIIIAIGVLFFVIIGLVNLEGSAFITGPIGHIIWILAPIFILIGIKRTE